MAGDWIKMRGDIEQRLEFMRLCRATGVDQAAGLFHLYRLASWFQEFGHYGKLRFDRNIIDSYLNVPGFADALESVGWLKDHGDTITLHYFTSVSTTRKSLGRNVRRAVLASGKCAVCGSPDELVIDHKTPIVRGGSCEQDNLQALCAPCNRRKGRKTMGEFLQC